MPKIEGVAVVEDLHTFDMADELQSQEDIAAYLTMVIEDGDAGELARARILRESKRYGDRCEGKRVDQGSIVSRTQARIKAQVRYH